MEDRHQQFNKVDLTPRRWHGYTVFLFILGTLLPPLAVAARFGIGRDFGINVFLTICGYIPGHVHNFYIQNIRNNKNSRRTPKWAVTYGLIDTTALERRQKRKQWSNRYNDRLPGSTLDGQPLADGQEGGSSTDLSTENNRSRSNRANGKNGDLWRPEDEQYYGAENGNAQTSGSGGRWHYPANFEDTLIDSSASKKKKKEKKDRWARTEDAYSVEGTPHKRKKSKRSKLRSGTDSDTRSRHSDSINEFPEDAEGGLYGDHGTRSAHPDSNNETLFTHEF